jgi:hypothetical protein
MTSDLSRSIVDAAATGMHNARCVCRQDGHPEAYREAAAVAVAAGLETLATHCDPVTVGSGSTEQALLGNTELRRLAAEVKDTQ